MKGRIVALCTSEIGGVPKHAQEKVRFAQFGIEHDFHCRPERKDFKEPGKTKPNDDRHITIVAEETYMYVKEKLDVTLWPGAFGENIHTSGLGDLSDIKPGTLLDLNYGAVIMRVTGQNKPCKNLQVYHREMVKTVYGRRGLLCTVVDGIGQSIKPGSIIEVIQPSRPKLDSPLQDLLEDLD